MKNRSMAVAIFVEGPCGQTVFVLDPFKKNPYKKLPGGKGEAVRIMEEGKEVERMETPPACAIRELRGETGLSIKEKDLTFIEYEDRGDHDFYLFKAVVKNFGGFRDLAYVEVFAMNTNYLSLLIY